ncbi:MAG TPA: BMP family ABC transporter substrate-binding protein [Ktedonobacterales bacterium]|nr:BMP family ABC transporter substrate-binding protein [Ktedonobacterales bacterium]
MSHPKLKFVVAGVLLLLLVPALAACGSSTTTPAAKKIKVGLVTDTGGLNDKSFNHLADVGLEKAKKELHIQGDVVESHSESDYVPNLTNFASKGYDLVIGVGFLMQTAVGTVSTNFPNVKFAIIDGSGTDAKGNDLKNPNVESLFFKEQDAGALVGAVAGALEKDNLTPKKSHVISAVGGISIPPVDHYIAGYKWAALQQDPTLKVLVGYGNDFSDPTKCGSVATAQIGQGSDVLFQVAGGCGLGVIKAADTASVYSIGVDADQKDAGTSVILSALKKVDVATYDAIKGVQSGSFQGGALIFSLANGGVGYAVDNLQLPADVKAAVDDLSAKIAAGTLTPPATIP